MPRITQEDVDQLAREHASKAADAALGYSEGEDVEEVTTAVTTPTSAAVGAAIEGVSGEADPTDFVLPFAKLAQKSSPTGTPGMFCKSTGDETDHIDFVILHVARTRTYYDGDGAELLCASRDRITGRPSQAVADENNVERGSLACHSCVHYQDDQYQKLACKFDYLLTLYDLKAEEPFLFRAKGASLKTWRQRLSPILAGNQPPWFAAFEMTAKTATNKKGQSWFEPEIKPIQRYDAETKATWASYAQPFGETRTDDVDFDDVPFSE